MKNILLAAMAVMTLVGPANATSDWDYFWGTTVSQALDPKLNGWDDFWYQCQDPNKGLGDCVGTVAAGIGMAAILPLVAVGVVATGVGLAAGGTATAIVSVPATGFYIMTSAGLVSVAPHSTTGLAQVALTASGGVVFM